VVVRVAGLPGRDSHLQVAVTWSHKLVVDVAHCADHLLVLGAELRSQSAHVNIDGADAAEELVAHTS
jgi:hypothetical protein